MRKHLLPSVLFSLGLLAIGCKGSPPSMSSAPVASAPAPAPVEEEERESVPAATIAAPVPASVRTGAPRPAAPRGAPPSEQPPSPAPPPSSAPPTPTPQPAPAALDIDAYVDSLPTESLAFNAPDRLLITETATVRLRLEPGLDGEAASAAFEATRAEDQSGEIRVATSAISPEMEASLTAAEGIEVRALTRERQAVSRRDPTEWLWEIKAVSGGSHRLMLSVYAFAPGGTAGRKVRTVEEQLLVEVPVARQITGFLGDNWEWLWTLLGAPLGAWIFARWRRQGQEPPAAT